MANIERLTQLANDLTIKRPLLSEMAPFILTLAPESPIVNLQITAAHETNATCEQGYNRDDIIEDWQARVAEGKGLQIILDLDENLFNTVLFWIEETNRILHEEYHIAEQLLPSPEQVLAAGGPSTYYPTHFPDIWAMATSDGTIWHPHTNPKSYEHLAEIWRHEEAGNLRPPLLSGLQPIQLMETFAHHGQVLGGLTARPATKRVIEATHQQTQQAGFEAEPSAAAVNRWQLAIIFRPKEVPLSESGAEKLRVITSILPEKNTEARVVLFDDSLSTAKVIAAHNEKVASNRKIAYILNAMGPLTAPKMDGALPKDPALAAQLTEEHGIFVLTSWDSMDDVLTRIEAWHSRNSSS